MVIARTNSTAGTSATLIKAGKTVVHGININTSGTFRCVRLYDKATAPTVGTDVPTVICGTNIGGRSIFFPEPLVFANGVGLGITSTNPSDTDTGAVGANDTVVEVFLG